MQPIKLSEITPEKLDEISWQWEENRISQLVRESVVELGNQWRAARSESQRLEAKSQIRAMRLYHQHGFKKREIANLFGTDLKTVNRWLK